MPQYFLHSFITSGAIIPEPPAGSIYKYWYLYLVMLSTRYSSARSTKLNFIVSARGYKYVHTDKNAVIYDYSGMGRNVNFFGG